VTPGQSEHDAIEDRPVGQERVEEDEVAAGAGLEHVERGVLCC